MFGYGWNEYVGLYCLRQETDHHCCEGRYNTFYVLYPVGIASEMYLIYQAIEPASEIRIGYVYLLRSILLAYIPGELRVLDSSRCIVILLAFYSLQFCFSHPTSWFLA